MHIRHRIQPTLIDLVAALVIAALIVVVPSTSFAQQKIAASPVASVAPHIEEEIESPNTQKPGEEGIKVHGHWIIDVKDKDGKVVEHRDFHNALVSDGNTLLITLLAGLTSAEQMEIGLSTSTNATAFGLYSSTSAFAVGATCTNYYTTCYSGLTRTYGVVTNKLSSIILSGSIPAQSAAYSVSGVSTIVNGCNSISNAATTVSPATCTGSVAASNSNSQFIVSNFTATTITPLSVAAGQALSVTVTLSFS